MEDVVQSALHCATCGGQCSFSPARGALECHSCGALYDLGTPEDDLACDEFTHRPELDTPDVPAPRGTTQHQCRNCGGEVVFTGAALSERCPYCDGPMVRNAGPWGRNGYATMALIPFRVDAALAQKLALGWVMARLAAPSDLGAVVMEGRVAGLYAPFWTFDSDEAVHYWAEYTTGYGENKRTHKTTGRLEIAFDDLLMPASPHITPLIRDGILHDFDPAALRPFGAGYLAGFAAEQHHQSVAQGLLANEADKDLLIRNHIKGHVNEGRVRVLRYHTDTTGIHYRRILLPVWILHYTYGGRPYKIVVSGIDGRSFGERPFSAVKLGLYAAAASALAIAAGIAWGAAGLL